MNSSAKAASCDRPDATVLGGTAYEHERRPLANALVGDLEPIPLDDLHRRTLYARSEQAAVVRRRRQMLALDDEQERRATRLLPSKPTVSGGRLDPRLAAPLDD